MAIHVHLHPARTADARAKRTADAKKTTRAQAQEALDGILDEIRSGNWDKMSDRAEAERELGNQVPSYPEWPKELMAEFVQKLMTAQASIKTKDAKRTGDCGCGGQGTKDSDTKVTYAEMKREYDKISRYAHGVAKIKRMMLEQFGEKAWKEHGQNFVEMEQHFSEDAAKTSDSATVDAAPVNALYLQLDRLPPSELEQKAEAKGIKAAAKTDRIMGLLRASFTPAQVEAWTLSY